MRLIYRTLTQPLTILIVHYFFEHVLEMYFRGQSRKSIGVFQNLKYLKLKLAFICLWRFVTILVIRDLPYKFYVYIDWNIKRANDYS